MIELSRKITEDAKQYEIRSGLETNAERKVLDLFNDLFTLNMIHNGGTVFGDNRKKKKYQVRKSIKKVFKLKRVKGLIQIIMSIKIDKIGYFVYIY